MYSNDNKNGFSILDLIVKIIFAGLFIFILVWLFNKKVPNMKPFYSNVFRENIRYMQEAGESYFTDEKMPTEVGQEIKISLGEMIEKKLIIPFIDEDGNECNNDESYVGITKLDEGYELKTNLVCPKENNYTVKLLGCHTYCLNGVCRPEKEEEKEEKVCTTTKVKQYQYKKLVTSTKSTYSCASGYTLKGKYCYKSVLVDSKPAESIPAGQRIDVQDAIAVTTPGSRIELTPIVKTDTVTANYNKITLETQKTTGTQTANYNKVQLETQKTTTPDTTKQVPYNCPTTERRCTTTYQSYSYSCNCTSSVGPTGKTITSCSTCYGSTPVESCSNVTVPKTCYRTETVPGTTTYSCPSDATIKEGSGASLKCYKTSCPSGYTMSGSGTSTKCTKTDTTYSCPADTTIKEGSGASLKCYKTSCPSGYTMSGSGINTKCTKTTKTYSCPAEANVKEGSGASLKCYKATEGSYYYKCADPSYTLDGNKCKKTITDSTLGCPSGYTLEGKTCNKYSTEEKKATEEKVTTNKYKYTWSAKTSLKGWTRTGKTRTVNGKKVCK